MKNDERLIYLISRAVTRLKYYSINKFQREGIDITPSQMGILFALSRRDGLSMTELSSLIDVDNSTLTRLADKLEKRGFVKRKKSISDRRALTLDITPSGIAEAAKAVIIAHEINNEIKAGFTDDEMSVFVKILNSFMNKFNI